MSKVILTGDIHRGVPGRTQDINWACRVIREYAKQANIDTIIVLGDLFHNRDSLAVDILQDAVDFHEEAATKYDQKWITFPGNHDMFLRHSWQINSLSPMRKYLTYINDVKILKLDDRRFWVLPFITFEKSYMNVKDAIERKIEPGDMLLTHIGVRGATLNTCFLLKDWGIVNFENTRFSKVFTGHFHSKQQIGNVYYPGSPIPFKFDEGDIAHGFYVYDTETDDQKFVNIWKAGAKFFPEEKAPPQFTTILDESLDSKTPTDINNNIVRVALQRDYTNDEKRYIKDRLLSMGAVSVRWWNMTQKMEQKLVDLATSSVPMKNLFNAWVTADTKGTQDLDLKILQQVNDDIVVEGDQAYSIEEVE